MMDVMVDSYSTRAPAPDRPYRGEHDVNFIEILPIDPLNLVEYTRPRWDGAQFRSISNAHLGK